MRIRLRRVRAADLLAGAVFALAGLMFASSAVTSDGHDIRTDRTGDLREQVEAQSGLIRSLQLEAADLQGQIEAEQATQENTAQQDEVEKVIADTAPQAGLTPAIGPSVTVELRDSILTPADFPDEAVVPDDLVIHQQDVQAVVNAMWTGGASALQVMDQRLISTSAVRCVGNTLVLQGRVYSPPFRITAVGDRGAIKAALDESADIDLLKYAAQRFKLGYSVTESDRTEIPAYAGPITPRVAKVDS